VVEEGDPEEEPVGVVRVVERPAVDDELGALGLALVDPADDDSRCSAE